MTDTVAITQPKPLQWSQKDFGNELDAWIHELKENSSLPVEVSLEFSNWVLRKGANGSFLVRRWADNELETHIVWSPIHECPMLLIKVASSGDLPKLNEGFVAGMEYHPVLDQVFFSIHACDTATWMQCLDVRKVLEQSRGVALLSWWSIMANRALDCLGIDPKVFALADEALQRGRRQCSEITGESLLIQGGT